MRFFCVKIKRRSTLALFLIVCLFSLICFDFLNNNTHKNHVITIDEQIAFLNDLGYKVNQKLYEKDIVIPYKFSEVFENYNNVQLAAGYNLKKYSGRKARLYCYSLFDDIGLNAGYVANIIIYENTIIGGDISSSSINGKMMPLMEKEHNENSKT